ncbi:MAG: VWA domain-containing protein [bacterium]
MTWQHPLILVLAPLALAAAWWLCRRGASRADARRFPNIAQLWADRHGLTTTPSRTHRRARGIALGAAAGLALIALARPQWGEIAEPRYQRGREVMLALDLSRSMLATDVSPSRLARAKLLVDALLDQLKGERVGLTVFAGTAFVQSPLSADYEVLRDLLAALEPSYLPQGGTDYAAMLSAAGEAFGAPGGGDRYLVVLSDGEAHDAAWQAALPALQERGIKVIGLGIGTPQGGVVPAENGGVMKDARGNAVLSKLEPATLQELASATGGTYRDAATWVDIAELVGGTVAQGRQGEYVEQQHVRLEDRFQWFLAPALLFFLLSYWLEFPVFPLSRALAARDTIGFAAQPSAPKGAAREGVIDDGLAAVSRGEQANAEAADWPALRQQLEALRKPPEPPQNKEKQDKQNQDDQSKDGSSAGVPPAKPENGEQQTGDSQAKNDQPQPGDSSSSPNQQPNQDEAKSGQPGENAQASDRENQQADKHDAAGSQGKQDESKQHAGEPSADHQNQPQPHDQDASGQVARQDDMKPLDAAGLGEPKDGDAKPGADAQAQADAKAAAPKPPQAATRLVGGGRPAADDSDAEAQGDVAMADALGRMRAVKQGDAPAVLFDRMNRAEGRPHQAQNEQDW